VRTLKSIVKERCSDQEFKRMYDEACHPCKTTLRIFRALEKKGLDWTALSEELGEDVTVMNQLMDGDCCDPKIVVRICVRLGLQPPLDCKRSPI
jgi:hypothetical protein